MAGGVLFGLGLILSAYAHTPSMMALTFGVLGGIGIGLGYSATTPPSLKWFSSKRKGLIAGIVVSGVGLAAVYIAPLTQYLLGKVGIAQTFQFLGLGAMVLIVALSFFLWNPPAGFVATGPSGTASQAVSRPEIDWPQMLRSGHFYVLWAMFALSASAGLMIIVHVATIAREQAGLQWGFVPVATLALFNTGGRILSGYLSDAIGRTQTMVMAFVLQALNMLAFSYYTTPPMLIFASAFTGLCYGTIFALFPAATADRYGVKNLGVNYGLVFTAFGLAGVMGPILGGDMRDRFGSYSAAYMSSALMLLVAAGLAFAARPPKSKT
jgi:OFA family oxalate/formate antiporter-like MFS transporter